MLRTFATTAIASIAMLGSAYAADLPSRKAPPVYIPPPPVFTWTGLYVGGQVGYAWGRDRLTSGAFLAPGTYAYSPSGVIGGAHLGYNWQTGIFVAGLEGDVNGSSYSKKVVNPLVATGPTDGTRIGIDGSIRGRIGLAYDRALFYATGGVAFAGINTNYLSAAGVYTSIGHTRVGWTVGGGIEYALNNNWSLRGEYRYTDFGSFVDFPAAVVLGRIHRETEHRIQGGFSYKFDMFAPPGPVVAKY